RSSSLRAADRPSMQESVALFHAWPVPQLVLTQVRLLPLYRVPLGQLFWLEDFVPGSLESSTAQVLDAVKYNRNRVAATTAIARSIASFLASQRLDYS